MSIISSLLPSRFPGTAKVRVQFHAAQFLLLCGGGMMSAALAGCGSQPHNVSPTSGLPPSTPAASSNAYIGTQSPLNWTFTVDDNQNAYSYQSLPTDSSRPAASSGTFVPQNGFLNLGAAGLALEISGAGAILRPGDNTTAPVAMVEQEGCLALTGQQRYLVQGMVRTTSPVTASPVVYRRGDLVASTTSDGKTWSFADAEYVDYKGNQISLLYQGRPSASSFTGKCAAAKGASSVSIDTSGAYLLPTTFRFGSAGMVVADYTTSTGPKVFSHAAAIGFAQPQYPLTVQLLASASYRGFQVEYSTASVTQPVSFGPAVDGSVALNGGTYPNDDVTQTADSSALFVFGSQSSSINGLFAKATMTVLDPKGGCALNNVSQADLGVTPSGIPTCRLHLSTMVGQVGGKALIVASGVD